MKIGILFDLDGTLMDTLEDLTDSVNYALTRFGCPPRTCMEIRSYLGNGAKQLIALSLPGKADDPNVEEVLALYKNYYDAHCQIKTRPYDGIPEALAKLGESYPLAVVSNKPDSAVKPLCRQYFPGIYAQGEDAKCPRKPAPDMMFAAMAAIGVDRCLYVGDSEVDVLTATNAGAPCISVTWGFRDKDVLEENGAQYFCDDPRDLPDIVEKIMGEIDGK